MKSNKMAGGAAVSMSSLSLGAALNNKINNRLNQRLNAVTLKGKTAQKQNEMK
jgi:predicted permease